jgi:hypothetical protein
MHQAPAGNSQKEKSAGRKFAKRKKRRPEIRSLFLSAMLLVFH